MEFKNELDNDCALHIKKEGAFCSPINIVDKLADFVTAFNNKPHHAGNELHLHSDSNPDTTNKTILDTLKKKYNCSNETCILNQSEVKQHIDPVLIDKVLKENFKPVGPRMTRDWLSNFDIDDVLRQVQKKYEDKHFLHIPFQMRDFQKTNSELAQLDWDKEYKNGYRTFGTVMNTDTSTGNGIHWFALFGDFLDDSKVFTIEYFNSSGELPLPEVDLWMKKTKHSLNFDKDVKDVVATRIQNQHSDTECGIYSLYYIISRLDGIPLEWFKNNRIKDERMYLFRKYLYREG